MLFSEWSQSSLRIPIVLTGLGKERGHIEHRESQSSLRIPIVLTGQRELDAPDSSIACLNPH